MNIGFIGTGHMASSIALGIDNSDYHFYLNDIIASKALSLSKVLTNSQVATIKEIGDCCDFIFLGIRPTDTTDLLKELSKYPTKAIIISMVAGYKIKEIEKYLNTKIIRILPNTPCLVKEGLTFVTYNKLIEPSDQKRFKSIMYHLGKLEEIDEELINKASVLTSSAPAYLDYFMDALIEAGISLGLKKEDATSYVLQMVKGTVKLCEKMDKSPIELGQEVCSVGGSTIEGVNKLLEYHIYDMMKDACFATYQKNNKMRGEENENL